MARMLRPMAKRRIMAFRAGAISVGEDEERIAAWRIVFKNYRRRFHCVLSRLSSINSINGRAKSRQADSGPPVDRVRQRAPSSWLSAFASALNEPPLSKFAI